MRACFFVWLSVGPSPPAPSLYCISVRITCVDQKNEQAESSWQDGPDEPSACARKTENDLTNPCMSMAGTRHGLGLVHVII